MRVVGKADPFPSVSFLVVWKNDDATPWCLSMRATVNQGIALQRKVFGVHTTPIWRGYYSKYVLPSPFMTWVQNGVMVVGVRGAVGGNSAPPFDL